MKRLLSLLALVALLVVSAADAHAQRADAPRTSESPRRAEANERAPSRRPSDGRATRTRDDDDTRRTPTRTSGQRSSAGWDDDARADDGRGKKHGKRKNGPAFCRSGAGHPVHGREWCREKGFGREQRDAAWERATWRDVVFGRTPTSRRDRLTERDLGAVLGREVMTRLHGLQQQRGRAGALEGAWAATDRGRVLRVHAGNAPLVEFADLDGDRRVERVRVAR